MFVPALILAAVLAPDHISLADGTVLEDVRIVSADIEVVVYTAEGRRGEQQVDSSAVLRITYTRFPEEMGDARDAFAAGSYGESADLWRDSITPKNERRYPWIKGHALFEIARCNRMVGELDDAIAILGELLADAPDCFYGAEAYLVRGNLLEMDDRRTQAAGEYQRLLDRVEERLLSVRWKWEGELRLLLLEKLTPEIREERLIEIAEATREDYPSISSRAWLEVGKSYIAAARFEDATAFFEEIIEKGGADDATLAGAYLGLGHCLFQSAGDDEARYRLALRHYMRVAVVFRDQVAYVPEALFFAGRCCEEIQDDAAKSKSRRLFMVCARDYGHTKWGQDARARLR